MSRCAQVFLSAQFLSVTLTASVFGAVQNQGVLNDRGGEHIVLSKKFVNMFHNWLREPASTNLEIVDHELERLRSGASLDYDSYDYFLYASGLLALASDRKDHAKRFLSVYLKRRCLDDAFERLPPNITSDSTISLLRSESALLQERVWKRWGADRWASHSSRAYEKGYEYESALANISLTDISQEELALLVSVPQAKTESNSSVFRDYGTLWIGLGTRRSGHQVDLKALLESLRDSDSPWPIPADLLDHLDTPPTLVAGVLRLRAVLTFSSMVLLLLIVKICFRGIPRPDSQPRSLSAATVQIPAVKNPHVESALSRVPSRQFEFIAKLRLGNRHMRSALVTVALLAITTTLLVITQHTTVVILQGIALAAALILLVLGWPRVRQDSTRTVEYELHLNDLFGYLCVRRWHGSLLAVFIATVTALAVTTAVLAWSEESLWRDSVVVNRPFFEFLSFPFAFGLLIPAFFLVGAMFYVRGGAIVDLAIRTISSGDSESHRNASSLWARYHRVVASRRIAIIFAILAGLVIVGLQTQWSRDPGIAFVDIRYPRYISLTGIYLSIAWGFVLYAFATLIFRYSCLLFFLASLFSKKHEVGWECKPDYNVSHPDKCCGLRPIGNFILRFYLLMTLLAASIILILIDRVRHFGSLTLGIQFGYISVVLFGIAFSVLAPVLIAYPIISMHLALRRYRYQKILHLSDLIAAQEKRLFDKVPAEACGEDKETWSWLYSMREHYANMSLWPIDFRTMAYFVASNLIPVTSFFLPLIAKRLGIDL